MVSLIRVWCIFEAVTDTNMKQLENGKETHQALVGNIEYNRREWRSNHYQRKMASHVPTPWVGRAGPIPRPPRSPDLTPCDFYVWGYVKDQIYQPPMPQSVRELREWISQPIANDDESHLWRTWEEFEYRVHVCRVTNRTHIKLL
jgi:hypothetical protein